MNALQKMLVQHCGTLRVCLLSADASVRQVMANLPYEQMHAPVVGPAHPFQKDGIAAGMRNHRAGHVEVSRLLAVRSSELGAHLPLIFMVAIAASDSKNTCCHMYLSFSATHLSPRSKVGTLVQDYHMHTFHFDDQYHTHHNYGYSVAPGGQDIVGDQEAFLAKKGDFTLLRKVTDLKVKVSEVKTYGAVKVLERPQLLQLPCWLRLVSRYLF